MELKHLKKHVRTLATLEETSSPVISCYLNLQRGTAGYRGALDARVRTLRSTLADQPRRDFEEALGKIEAFVATDLFPDAKGAAIFARAGAQPFFLPLQFLVPLPNWIAVGSDPNIYHLCELKDVYHRYVVMLATGRSTRILEVNLGSVTKQLWRERPRLRERVGRGWTKEHYQAHRKERTRQFLKEQIKVLNTVMSKGGYTHLILAGDPRVASQVEKLLPKALAQKLIDVVPVAGSDNAEDVVMATLAAFIEREERESRAMVELLQRQLNTNGLAVAGTHDTFLALWRGQADALVIARAYEPEHGYWSCLACGRAGVSEEVPGVCPECEEDQTREIDMKEEMVRLAERAGCEIETLEDSDVLMRLGGVGCLLRYLTPEQRCECVPALAGQ